LNENELTPEQKELKNFFQTNSEKTNITRSELEQEAASFAPNTSPNNKDGDSNAGIIAAVVVLGLIITLAIGFVIGQKKRRNY
jgi:hypothetical protein